MASVLFRWDFVFCLGAGEVLGLGLRLMVVPKCNL